VKKSVSKFAFQTQPAPLHNVPGIRAAKKENKKAFEAGLNSR
jgi:hypothetical protein